MQLITTTREDNKFLQLLELMKTEWGNLGDNYGLESNYLESCVAVSDDNKVIGGYLIHKESILEYLHLTAIIVAKEHRSQGVGKMLLDHVKEVARKDTRDIQLYAESWNVRSCSFYEKNDFEHIEDVEEMYDENNGKAKVYYWFYDDYKTTDM